MCIIIAKPKGIAMPPENWLEASFRANSDGAGFMLADGHNVVIRKGYMSYEAFTRAIESEGNLTDKAVVMHFRIATHGLVDAGRCHPFPVCDDYKHMARTFNVVQLGLAHNGILSIKPPNETVSDSMTFIKECLKSPDVIDRLREHADHQMLLEEAISGSRLAFLEPSGEITLFGCGWQEDKGISFSNSSYKPKTWSYKSWNKKRSYSSMGYGGGWDDDLFTRSSKTKQEERPVRTHCPLCAAKAVRASGWCESCEEWTVFEGAYLCDVCGEQAVVTSGHCLSCQRTYDACQLCGQYGYDVDEGLCFACGTTDEELQEFEANGYGMLDEDLGETDTKLLPPVGSVIDTLG